MARYWPEAYLLEQNHALLIERNHLYDRKNQHAHSLKKMPFGRLFQYPEEDHPYLIEQLRVTRLFYLAYNVAFTIALSGMLSGNCVSLLSYSA